MKRPNTNHPSASGVNGVRLPRRWKTSLQRTKTGLAAVPEMRLQRILVPVDLTACSRAAVEYAALLAMPQRATITLLYVVEPDCPRDGQNTSTRHSSEVRLLAQIQKQLAALTEQSIRGRAQCETLIRFGSPQIEIETVARDQSMDLIILATHGERGLPDFCFASTPEKVLRYAPCPVLIVRQQERDLYDGNFTPSKPKGNL